MADTGDGSGRRDKSLRWAMVFAVMISCDGLVRSDDAFGDAAGDIAACHGQYVSLYDVDARCLSSTRGACMPEGSGGCIAEAACYVEKTSGLIYRGENCGPVDSNWDVCDAATWAQVKTWTYCPEVDAR